MEAKTCYVYITNPDIQQLNSDAKKYIALCKVVDSEVSAEKPLQWASIPILGALNCISWKPEYSIFFSTVSSIPKDAPIFISDQTEASWDKSYLYTPGLWTITDNPPQVTSITIQNGIENHVCSFGVMQKISINNQVDVIQPISAISLITNTACTFQAPISTKVKIYISNNKDVGIDPDNYEVTSGFTVDTDKPGPYILQYLVSTGNWTTLTEIPSPYHTPSKATNNDNNVMTDDTSYNNKEGQTETKRNKKTFACFGPKSKNTKN